MPWGCRHRILKRHMMRAQIAKRVPDASNRVMLPLICTKHLDMQKRHKMHATRRDMRREISWRGYCFHKWTTQWSSVISHVIHVSSESETFFDSSQIIDATLLRNVCDNHRLLRSWSARVLRHVILNRCYRVYHAIYELQFVTAATRMPTSMPHVYVCELRTIQIIQDMFW